MSFKLNKKISFLIIIIAFQGLSFSQHSKKLDPIDIFALEHISSPEISPTGDKVLYQRNFKDIMTDKSLSNIWLVNFDGSNNRPVTTGNNDDFSPRWSNSGKMFLYKSNVDGKTQLYLFNLNTNSTQKLTNVQSSIGNVQWSDDDKHILFTSFVKDTKNNLIKMPEKPDGAKWNNLQLK